MKIWIVTHYANWPHEPGGTRHFAFGRELVARGHEVLIVTGSFQHMLRSETRLGPRERERSDVVDGVRHVWLRTPAFKQGAVRRLVNQATFAGKVWRRRPDDGPDIVVGSSPDPLSTLAASRVARTYGVPFVYEIRDLWPESLVQLGGLARRHPAVQAFDRIERHLARTADAVVSVSPGVGEYFRSRLGDDAPDVAWIPNGVDLTAAGAPVAYPDGNGVTFLYAGSHGTANALDVIIDAAHELHQTGRAAGITIRMVGEGPDKPALQHRARELGLDFVRFEPARPKAEIFPLLGEADAFLIALGDNDLYRWGFSPNKLWDYLAAARPVVMASPSPYDPVTEALAGITVPAGDPAALADAMHGLAQRSPAERAAMGRSGRAYVETRHAISELAAEYERLLIGVVERAAPA